LCAVLLWWLETACDKDLAKQVPKRNVAAPFQRKVYAAFYEFVFGLLKCDIKCMEFASFDSRTERKEELLQPRVGFEKLVSGQGVRGEEVARDEIREDQPEGHVSMVTDAGGDHQHTPYCALPSGDKGSMPWSGVSQTKSM
jgi:hypothetical protein